MFRQLSLALRLSRFALSGALKCALIRSRIGHMLFLDGVYIDAPKTKFKRVMAPSHEELGATSAHTAIERILPLPAMHVDETSGNSIPVGGAFIQV